jgi:hypothetical protein
VLRGASSNRAVWFFRDGEDVVKLSTIEEGFEACLDDRTVPSVRLGGNGRVSFGDSGEKEGNEVRDLSEIDEAELDMCEEYFRGLPRTVCDL